MTPLDEAFEKIALHEGGEFTNDPADPGGATQWGISLRYLRTLDPRIGDLDHDGDVDAADIRLVTRDDLRREVERMWNANGYGRLPEYAAVKVCDLAWNMGPRQAHRLLQRACRACEESVVEDGILGPKTVAAVVRVEPHEALLASLRSEAAGFYRSLVAGNPSMGRFERGWIARAYA